MLWTIKENLEAMKECFAEDLEILKDLWKRMKKWFPKWWMVILVVATGGLVGGIIAGTVLADWNLEQKAVRMAEEFFTGFVNWDLKRMTRVADLYVLVTNPLVEELADKSGEVIHWILEDMFPGYKHVVAKVESYDFDRVGNKAYLEIGRLVLTAYGDRSMDRGLFNERPLLVTFEKRGFRWKIEDIEWNREIY